MAKLSKNGKKLYASKGDFSLVECNQCHQKKPIEFIVELKRNGMHYESFCCRTCYDELPD